MMRAAVRGVAAILFFLVIGYGHCDLADLLERHIHPPQLCIYEIGSMRAVKFSVVHVADVVEITCNLPEFTVSLRIAELPQNTACSGGNITYVPYPVFCIA